LANLGSKLVPKGPLQHSRAAHSEGGGLHQVALEGVEFGLQYIERYLMI